MRSIRTASAVAAALLAFNAFAQQPPPPGRPPAGERAARPPAPGAERGTEIALSGRVARWLVNPNGEVDGLLLDDGTQVGFPPHLSAQLVEAVKTKDAVEITGVRSEGAKVVRAWTIRSTRSDRTVSVAAGEPGFAPAPPRAAGALTAMNASGRIDALLYTGRGDVKGVLLQDGTVVRFPPHVAEGMGDVLRPGGALYARGYGTRSPQGSAFEATALGPTAERAVEVFAGSAPRGGARAPMPPVPPVGERPPAPDAPPPPRVPA